MSKSSTFKSPLRPSGARASLPDTSHEPESEMEINIVSDVTHQPSTASPSHRSASVATTTSEDPVLDQFQQMRSMIWVSWVSVRILLQIHDSHSATISTPRLNTWRSETFLPSGMRQCNFLVEYRTRLKNVRDRSQYFNFQKQHRPQQDVKHPHDILVTQQVSAPAVQPTQIAAPQPPTVIAKFKHRGQHQRHHSLHLFLLWMTSSLGLPETNVCSKPNK